MCPNLLNNKFSSQFLIKRPGYIIQQFNDFHSLIDQLVVIEFIQNKELVFRGQIDYLEDKDQFLFVGTPWFGSMDQVRKFNLTIHNFALHDPLVELLHVLKNQEITNDEIKHLLIKVNDQKDKLKLSEKKYRNIVEQASDIIYKYSLDGHYTYVNEVAVRLTGYKKEELYKMNYLDLVRFDFKKQVEDFYLNQIYNQISTTYFEFPIVSKEGKEIWIGQSVQFPINNEIDKELTALAINITERKNAELNLTLQEEKYRNIIANMNLGLLEVDDNDVIMFANQSFCIMSGYSIDELRGNKAADLLLDENKRKIVLQKNKIRKDNVSDMYSIPITNKKGEKRWWVISGAPRYNDNGDLVGSVGIHLDVTDQKELEEELKIAKNKAEESSIAKESFLATMSHEIRTPLNAILGLTNMMKMNPKSRTDENIDILGFSSKNLLSLITDILDFSKIEAGKIELANNIIDLHNLLESTYQTFKNSCEDKGITLSLKINSTVPNFIIGDELRLSQILNNLLSNALKFTLKGGIEINAESIGISINKTRLIITIKDTGIGIPKNKLLTIFKAFEQAENTISNRFGGTGLGLNITKKLIELQNGEIEVKSKPKQGSEFTFTIDYYIPKNNGVSHQISGKTNVSKSVTLKNKNILLVEDNLINQKVAVSFLNFWEINCDIANNGKEALDMLELKHYDLVLMDIFMPIMDGFEAIKNIRKNKLFADLPIIALTASAELSIMNKVLSLGANQYLMKPFNPEQLQDSLLDLLGNGKNESTIWVKNQGQVEENQNFEIINLKLLKETSFNSNDFILEMLNLVLIEVPIIISNAETCLQNEKYELFSNSIHKLKSTLLLIGIEKLHADLNFMETFSKKNENISEVKLRFISLIDTWKLAIDEIQLAIKQING